MAVLGCCPGGGDQHLCAICAGERHSPGAFRSTPRRLWCRWAC